MTPEEIEKGMVKMEELYANLYFQMAAEYMRTFGEKGESALRQAIRDYGANRGALNRAAHEKLGLPIHLHTLFTMGGFPGKAGFKRNLFSLKPEERISETLVCPLNDHWKELGGQKEGVVYCEEIHAAMWAAYDPGIETRQPKIMTRGDECCKFEVLMPSAKGAPEKATGPTRTPEENLQVMMDLQAKMYYYLAKGLIDNFGLPGEAAVRRAIRRFGWERGKKLRAEHLAKGLEINTYNLFTYYDLPGDSRFKRNRIDFTTETRLSETLECTFYEVWRTFADGNRLGRIYCEEIHHQIFGAYDSAVQTNLATTLTQGDDRCRFAVYLRPANKIEEPEWVGHYRKKRGL
jgi:hypothetical protein